MLNLTALKTPGVYIDEVSKFPPSIAAVETAIPAFIGYTEKAMKNGVDLMNPITPVMIKSIAEYIEIFGSDPPYSNTVVLGSNNQVTRVKAQKTFHLYNSLRMFYDNGGGKCYIVPVGSYDAVSVDLTKLKAGLSAVETIDEVTILLSPDASLLENDDLYNFQIAALGQCEKLMDRVALCDLKKVNQTVANETLADMVQEFRSKIGVSALKYGAAYMPYLKTIFQKTIWLRDIKLKSGTDTGPDVKLEDLTSDPGILQIIFDVNNAIESNNRLKTTYGSLLDSDTLTIEGQFKKKLDALNSLSGNMNIAYMDGLKALYGILINIIKIGIDEFALLPTIVLTAPSPPSKTSTSAFTLKNDIQNNQVVLKPIFESILHHYNAMVASNTTVNKDLLDPTLLTAQILSTFGIADHTTVTDGTVSNNYNSASSNLARVELAKKHANNIFTSFANSINSLRAKAKNYEETLNYSLVEAFGFYKNLLNRINEDLSCIPPSGAVAGVYAKVDALRGVWKAPANESLASVSGPDVLITHSDQENLNVDVNSGKSINAIRAFTGKGTMIWGARTLAGNDNEWRYISVRRFFNMVEESTKKSTEAFVFEPNDANTWVKVQGMIENFLNTLWRVGALQGAKPEHAYYVAVGLGKTMTPLDILEGRMIVEIGMAVVRPAEFIVLKFSHKMAES